MVNDSPQVAATTGHQVTVVDQTNAILTKSMRSIEKGLNRVANKKFKDDPEVGAHCFVFINFFTPGSAKSKIVQFSKT